MTQGRAALLHAWRAWSESGDAPDDAWQRLISWQVRLWIATALFGANHVASIQALLALWAGEDSALRGRWPSDNVAPSLGPPPPGGVLVAHAATLCPLVLRGPSLDEGAAALVAWLSWYHGALGERPSRAGDLQDARAAKRAAGVYYTPADLAEQLVAPLPPEREASGCGASRAANDPSQQLLLTRICDPSCGVGNLLIHALRQSLQERCALDEAGWYRALNTDVYGADIDADAVDLCRLALWWPVRHLGPPPESLFTHIRVGDALGLRPAAWTSSLPRSAWVAWWGVDAASVSRERVADRRARKNEEALVRALSADTRAWLWAGAFLIDETFGLAPAHAGRWQQLAEGQSEARRWLRALRQELHTRYGLLSWDASCVPDVAAAGGFSWVVGNPPFLTPLREASVAERAMRRLLRYGTPGALGGFADTAAVFMETFAERLAPGGRLSMVQPLSLLSTQHCQGLRDELAPRLRRLRSLEAPGFGQAQVRVLLVDLVDRAGSAPVVQGEDPWRNLRTELQRCGSGWVEAPHERQRDGGSWADSGATLADIATVEADFLQAYYAMRPFVVEAEEAPVGPEVWVAGMIDPALVMWGVRPARIFKRTWRFPRADSAAIRTNAPHLVPWLEKRAVPRVVVATMTTVLEVVVDEGGRSVNITPTLTVRPLASQSLWRIAALLASPYASWVARQAIAGGGRSRESLQPTAPMLRDLRVPAREEPWDRGAAAFQRAQAVTERADREAALRDMGAAMQEAYGRDAEGEVWAWWLERMRQVVARGGGR